jgi:hypothetical protein
MKTELADWKTFYIEGARYHRTAQGSVRRPEVFTPVLIENITAMGIEKYFMAIFMHRGALPHNHTLVDLLEEASTFMVLDAELVDSLRFMDSLQRICSLYDITIIPPTVADVPRFISAINAVALLAEAELGPVPETA